MLGSDFSGLDFQKKQALWEKQAHKSKHYWKTRYVYGLKSKSTKNDGFLNYESPLRGGQLTVRGSDFSGLDFLKQSKHFEKSKRKKQALCQVRVSVWPVHENDQPEVLSCNKAPDFRFKIANTQVLQQKQALWEKQAQKQALCQVRVSIWSVYENDQFLNAKY